MTRSGENNIYFERAIANFIDCSITNRTPRRRSASASTTSSMRPSAPNGYGLKSFRRSLVTCFERLASCAASDEHVDCIHGFTHIIDRHEIELLPGVEETLADLATRHQIILMTKGGTTASRPASLIAPASRNTSPPSKS